MVFELHDHERETLPQRRTKIIAQVARRTGGRGIWVLDRGNDDQKLFAELATSKLKFVIRIRKNRKFVDCKTGEVRPVTGFSAGKHRVMLPVTGAIYTLVVAQVCATLPPIYVITNLDSGSAITIAEQYLRRWEVENLYRQLKTKYNLEAIRLLSLTKIINLLAILQLAVAINNDCYEKVSSAEESQTITALSFKNYCYHRSLSPNRFAFTGFFAEVVRDIAAAVPKKPTGQLSLLSWRGVGKVGVL